MESSSKRDTHLERALFNHCRSILAHLICGVLYSEQDVLLPAFKELLDMDSAVLKRMYKPRIESHMSSAQKEEVAATADTVRNMEEASRTKKQSERLWEVGCRCADIGWCLNQTGKARQAVQWCEWSEELQKMAYGQAELEREM